MLQPILFFVLGLVLIFLGGDKLVDAAVAIAAKLGIPQIVVGATIVSLGTTLPEILVSTNAAFSGSAAIAAGNAIGSIICNTALIAGMVQAIRPSSGIEGSVLLWRSIFFFVVIVAMEGIGLATGEFGNMVGIALIFSFAVYGYLNIVRAEEDAEGDENPDASNVSIPKQLMILAVCAALLYEGANLLVENGIILAEAFGVPERVIAVTFIALGTSLPELVTSMASVLKGFGNLGLGNVIGANTINLLLVIGIPSAVAGIPVEDSTLMVDMPIAMLVMALLLVPILIRRQASRIQGVLLLGIYAAYCILSFI